MPPQSAIQSTPTKLICQTQWSYHSYASSSHAAYLLLDVRSFGVGNDGDVWCRADASIKLGIPVDIPVWRRRRGRSSGRLVAGHSDEIDGCSK